jgi:membrane-associated phospholipid phosphatase
MLEGKILLLPDATHAPHINTLNDSDATMPTKRFFPIEWLTFSYVVSTLIYLLIYFSEVQNPGQLINVRLLIILFMGMGAYVAGKKDSKVLDAIRQFIPFLLLGYWYSETFYFSTLFTTNKDPFFFNLEQYLFGTQPSLAFSRILPMRWFSELMYFGYFSYYLFLFVVPLWFWIRHPNDYDRLIFIIMASFFLYYLIYDLLPVAGPQFFFQGKDAEVPEGYFFSHTVRLIQHLGEKPTAAFPSSHVGMTFIVLLFTAQRDRRLFYWLLPFALNLMCSTVYIKAHYLIDVFGGLVSAIALYYFTGWLYNLSLRRDVFRLPTRWAAFLREQEEALKELGHKSTDNEH